MRGRRLKEPRSGATRRSAEDAISERRRSDADDDSVAVAAGRASPGSGEVEALRAALPWSYWGRGEDAGGAVLLRQQ